MGHIKSQYMAGVINMIGLGVPQDKTHVWTLYFNFTGSVSPLHTESTVVSKHCLI